MTLASSLYLLILFVVMITSGLVIVLTWPRQHEQIQRDFILLHASAFLYAFTILMMTFAVTDAGVIFWYSLRNVWLVLGCLFLTLIAVGSAPLTAKALRRMRRVLIGSALVAAAVIITDPLHRSVMSAGEVIQTAGLNGVMATTGPLLAPLGVYISGVNLIFIYYLSQTIYRLRGEARRQYVYILIGGVVVIAVNFGYFIRLYPPGLPPLMPIPVAIATAIYAWAMLKRQIFNVVPIAHSQIIEQMPALVAVVDTDGRILTMNARAQQYFRAAVPGSAFKQIDDLPSVPKQWRALSAHTGEIEIDSKAVGLSTGSPESTLVLAGPAVRSFALSINPLKRDDGAVIGYAFIWRDITEHKLNQQRAQELRSERDRAEFLASFIPMLSHELRTPLATINLASYAAGKISDEPTRRAKLKLIEEQTLRLARALDDVELLGQFERGAEVSMRHVDVGAIVRYVPDSISDVISKKRLMFRVDVRIAKPILIGNQDLLRRAFLSLLENAVRHAPPTSAVTIALERHGALLELRVSDEGPGLAPADINRIFEPFHKINMARTTDGSGLGLGLPLVKRIAELHSGNITVTSDPGKGSAFHLVLPLYDLPMIDDDADETADYPAPPQPPSVSSAR